MTLQERAEKALENCDGRQSDYEWALVRAMGEVIEEAAKLADFWAADEGHSPCHANANRFGQKVAGKAIAESIRKLAN